MVQAASGSHRQESPHLTPYNLRSGRQPSAARDQAGTATDSGKAKAKRTAKGTKAKQNPTKKGKSRARRVKSPSPSSSESESDEYTPRDPNDYNDPPEDSDNEMHAPSITLKGQDQLSSKQQKEDEREDAGVAQTQARDRSKQHGNNEPGTMREEAALSSPEKVGLGLESTRVIQDGDAELQFDFCDEDEEWRGIETDNEEKSTKSNESVVDGTSEGEGSNAKSKGKGKQKETKNRNQGSAPVSSPISNLSILTNEKLRTHMNDMSAAPDKNSSSKAPEGLESSNTKQDRTMTTSH
ncbi:hypothetical protein SCHPADRAFT_897370, partial [Schizopora paradoxa]